MQAWVWLPAWALFALPGPAGALTPYLLDVVALVVLVAVAARGSLISGFRETTSAALALGTLLVALCFAITMREPSDLSYAVNFAPLLFCGPLVALFAEARGPRNSLRVAWLALGGAALIATVALVNTTVFQFPRAASGVFPPITLANTALLFGFIAMGGVWQANGARRWVFLAGPAFGVLVALLTESRGPLVGVLPMALVSCWFLSRTRAVRPAAVVAGAVVALASLGALVAMAPGRLGTLLAIAGELVAGRGVSDYTTASRLALYEAGWQAFREAPWLGHGWARLTAAVLPHLPESLLEHATTLPQLHNDVVNFAVAAGVAGVAIYLLLLAAPVVGALRSARDGQRDFRLHGTIVVATGYACAGLTDIMIGFEFHTTLLAFLAAVLVSLCRDGAEVR